MNKLFVVILALSALVGVSSAYACSEMRPEFAFVHENDKDHDGKLNLDEWRQPEMHNFIMTFNPGDEADFATLDSDQDGFVTPIDLDGQVRYQRGPCADWPPYPH